ncbi:hypothetical protein J2W22_003378 [Sphingomonas kyeonggiensis]|uniref:hypothetical protein n=1 Tax=Sphingomonas kyeonggiensis TaxID=1268553 RepID=UPI0027894673|nr:hypothetical protein [Sphingomonas kyeonggiensis]MDQ0251314.1 hypothetical protein [Sphingomonas kyeonggiensis]
MFFLSLALLGQSVTLDADTGKAARQCVAAFTRAERAKGSIRSISRRVYLGQVYARAEGADDAHFFDSVLSGYRKGQMQAERGVDSPSLAACDKRFPKARAAAPVSLPADPETRDAICGATFLLLYLASAMGLDDEESSWWQQEGSRDYGRAMKRLREVSRKRGLADFDFNRAKPLLGEALRSAGDIGNPEAIQESCSKLLTQP